MANWPCALPAPAAFAGARHGVSSQREAKVFCLPQHDRAVRMYQFSVNGSDDWEFKEADQQRSLGVS